ncbi:MAG: GAF domain-containing protein [Anaerolinea sp.]
MLRSSPRSPVSLRRQLNLRLTILIVIVFSVLLAAAVIRTFDSQTSTLREEHENAIERAAFNVANRLQPLIDATNLAATDSRFVAFAQGAVQVTVASQLAADMIRANPADVQYISFLDTEGRLVFEMINANGQPQIVQQARLRERPFVRPEAAFYNALQSDGEVFLGRFGLARDPNTNQIIQPIRPSVALYRPVKNNVNDVIGVYRVTLDATNLLNIVNQATTNFINPEQNRSVILTVGANLVVADNNAESRLYLEQFEAFTGNLDADPLYGRLVPYLSQLRPVNALLDRVENTFITVAPVNLRNLVGPTMHVFIIDDFFAVYAESLTTVLIAGLAIVLLAVVVMLLQQQFVNRMLAPVEEAAAAMARLVDEENATDAGGALQAVVPQIAARLERLDRDHTQQVERRNRELRVMGRIGFESTAQKDLDALMKRSINLICTEMGFYHAQVFIIDRFENVARLAYSRGEAGQEMLARRHALEIGSASVIGAVAAERRIVIINDVDDPNNEFPHRYNPLLPDTKAEMALPLIANNELLGVLDIQSREKNVFLPDDQPTYELLANQLAVAMFNARLRTQTEERLEQIARLNRQLTRAVWSDTAANLQLAETFGRLPEAPQVKVPIRVRGEEIARIEAAIPNGQTSETDRLVLQAVADRIALAIENVRLFEQTQASLAETSTLYRLSQTLNEASTLEDILRVVATTIAADAADALLWLFDSDALMQSQARLAADVRLTDRITTHNVPLQTTLALPNFIATLDSTEVSHIADVNAALLDPPLRTLLQALSTVSLIVVPLNMRGVWRGFVTIHFTQPRALSEREKRLFNALIAAAGVAVDNQNLLAETEFERANLTNILATLPAGVLVLDPITLVPVQVNARARELMPEADFTQPFSADAYHLYRTAAASPYPEDQLPIFVTQRTQQPAYVDDVSYQWGSTHIDLLLNAAPVVDAQQRIIGIVAAFQDITNLRALESALQENLQETMVLYETQRVLAEAMSLDELLDAALAQTSLREVDDVHIVFIDEMTETLTLERYLKTPLQNLALLRPLLSPTDEIIYDDLTTAELGPELMAMLAAVPMGCLMVAPLRSRTRPLPFGWILFSQQQPNGFDNDDVRFLTTLADMISTAVESIFLVMSTQAALQETAALYSASSTINRARDLQDVSDALNQALEGLEPDVFAGYLMRDEQIVQLFNQGFEERLHTADLQELITLPLGEDNLIVDDLHGAADLPILNELRRMDGLAAVGVANLRIQDVVSGRLFVAYLRPHIFKPGDERYLSSVADSASVVIDNIVLLDQVQETLQETSTLYQSSRELTNARLPQEVLEVAVTHLADIHVFGVMVAMIDSPAWQEVTSSAAVEAVWHIDSDPTLLPTDLYPDQAIWPLLDVEAVTIYQQEDMLPEQAAELAELGAVTMAVLPLRTPQRTLGALIILSGTPHVYSERELRVLQSFAEQASLSLEAARLLAQTERRAAQLQATAEISERIGQILELDELLPQLVDLIRDRFFFDHVQVFLMDDNDEYAVLRASTGEAGKQLLARNHRLAKGSASVIGQVTAYNRVIIASDTSDATVPHRPNPLLPDTRSEMALPLVVKGKVVGALDVQSNRSNAFTQEDIQTLSTLAAQISIAIDNARNYETARSRAAEMSFLFDVTNAATSAETLQESLNAILDRIEESLEPDVVVFFLLTRSVDLKRNEVFNLQPAGARGLDLPYEAIEPVRLGDNENLISITAVTRQPQIVNNISKEVRYPAYSPASQSAILIPISSGADLLGLLVLESSQLNAYTGDMQTLLMALAGSLAAVLENTLLLEELQKTNERLREVDRLKSQFLANMSHELRTPLNSIIGFSRVMLRGIDGPLTEMQEQDLTTIFNSGNHLLNLINDILDQAKIEANEMQLKLERFDVKPMIEGVKSIAVGLIKDKPLQLFVEVAPNLPQAFADEFRTRQILLNLMSNAIKFTAQGSVTLRVYQTQTDDGKVAIRADVIDTGIGIAEEDMPILFEQFRQVDNSLTRTAGGTGLGLPISKALAELQGGQLLVESQVGVGSTFSVIIPTEPASADAATTLTLHLQDGESVNGAGSDDTKVTSPVPATTTTQIAPRVELPAMPAKREVLIIEDNKDMVDQFRRTLQREGFEVVTADHPSYAEAMVGQLRPTMVLLDVNFAQGAGWQILTNLKRRDDTGEIPIIVTTLSPERERALAAGADRYLQRPFMPDQLVKLVREVEAEFSRQRILVIDDQPEALRLLKQILSESGHYRVYVADNGQDGISMVARRRPDLVVLDLRMPNMDGFAVLNELRANPETAKIPVMVVTGDINLNATEQEQLAHVRIVPKTQITNEQYNQFLNVIKNELKTL